MNSERIRSRVALAAVALLVAACSSAWRHRCAGSIGRRARGASPAAGTADSPAAGGGRCGRRGRLHPHRLEGLPAPVLAGRQEGCREEGRQLNAEVNFIGPASESEVAKQIEMLQAEFDKNPAAICFAALDSQAANPLLEQFQEHGVPVIAFDSGVDSDIPITTAATDNVAAAGLAADKMAEPIGGAGKVGVIVHDQTSRTGIDRSEGFVNRMAARHPDIEMIGPQYGAGDQLKSTDLAKAMIQANPDIKGFFGGNEGSAIGVVNAVNELDMAGELVVIGYDSGQAQIDAIKSGLMPGAVQQNPIGIGAQCVAAADGPPGTRGPADHRHRLHLGRCVEHRLPRRWAVLYQ